MAIDKADRKGKMLRIREDADLINEVEYQAFLELRRREGT